MSNVNIHATECSGYCDFPQCQIQEQKQQNKKRKQKQHNKNQLMQQPLYKMHNGNGYLNRLTRTGLSNYRFFKHTFINNKESVHLPSIRLPPSHPPPPLHTHTHNILTQHTHTYPDKHTHTHTRTPLYDYPQLSCLLVSPKPAVVTVTPQSRDQGKEELSNVMLLDDVTRQRPAWLQPSTVT